MMTAFPEAFTDSVRAPYHGAGEAPRATAPFRRSNLLMTAPISRSAASPTTTLVRRPWIEPAITRHASLTALTQFAYQQSDPYFNEIGEPIPCSQGFCPS